MTGTNPATIDHRWPILLAATAAITLFPLINMIGRYDYGFLHSEVMLAALLLLALPLSLAWLVSKSSPQLANLVLALFALIALIVRANLLIAWIAAGLVGLLVLVRLLGLRFPVVALVVFATMSLVALIEQPMIRTQPPSTWQYPEAVEDRPSVIHLMLDGQIGIGGLPSMSGSSELGQAWLTLMQDFGFEHYPFAYSRYRATVNSLDHAFGYRSDGVSSIAKSDVVDGSGDLSRSAYFDDLVEAGYRINVFNSEGFTFCASANRGHCFDHPIPDLGSLHRAELSTWNKTIRLLKVLGRQSRVVDAAMSSMKIEATGISHFDHRTLAAPFAELARAPRGQVFFSHVLLPHDPYVYDQHCRFEPQRPVIDVIPRDGPYRPNTAVTRNARYRNYFQQSLCAVRLIREQLEWLENQGWLEQAIVLIHGDHGSKLSIANLLGVAHENVTLTDLLDNYSVLFAARFPGAEYSLDNRTLPLESLMADFAYRVTDLPRVSPSTEPFIYLGELSPLNRVDVDLFAALKAEGKKGVEEP